MDSCFVIQPFDKDVFDKRYHDVFAPAIVEAKLEPYRVDKDPSVRIPINDIEDGIKKAKICFAELTTDNPNVWYELGYAFASSKDVVMVCSEERHAKFPFDIQHKQIITYKVGSKSDYENLERKITEKLTALLNRREKVQSIIENPLKESEGLQQHEVTMMVFILESQLTEHDTVSAYNLQRDMESAGFTKAAANIAFRQLKAKEYIMFQKEYSNFNNEDITVVYLTAKGEEWILNNQDKIALKQNDSIVQTSFNSNDELPF